MPVRMCNLSAMYNQGLGVPQKLKEAPVWFRKAANQGHAHAQWNPGIMYNQDQGVIQDFMEDS